MTKRIIGHIDMDAFFAAVEQRDNPSLTGRPVVIGADPKGGQGRGVVATCSYEARRYGIRSAMPISKAYQRCPSAHFMRGNMRKYSDISRQVFRLLYDFTDMIQPVSIDEAYFDITSSFHLFQTPLNTGRQIKLKIQKQLRLNASIGIAPIKMAAKIASDFCKPDGLLEIKEQDLLNFLGKLPVGRLPGVGDKTLRALNKIGIKTVKDLGCRSKHDLQRQFGEQGRHLHDLANGIDLREVRVNDDIKSVSHEHTFETDTNTIKIIEDTLSSLSQKVSRRLRKNGLKGRTISLKIRTSDFKTFLRSKTIPDRTNYFDDIYAIARKMFHEFDSRQKEIRLLGVKVSHFDDPYICDSLFSASENARREKIHQVVDIIKDKFGDASIKRANI